MISKKDQEKNMAHGLIGNYFFFFIIFFKDLFYVWVSACMCLVCMPCTVECSGNRASDFLELELPLVVNL